MKHIILALVCVLTFHTIAIAQDTSSQQSRKRELKIAGDTLSHSVDMQKVQENLKRNQGTFDKIGKKMEAKKERQRLIEESIVEITVAAITALIAAIIMVLIRKSRKNKYKN